MPHLSATAKRAPPPHNKLGTPLYTQWIRKIGRSIKSFRTAGGLKQDELAHKIELSTRHYQKIEAGQVDLKTSTAQRITNHLKIEPCYLFRGENKRALESLELYCPVEILELLPAGVQLHNMRGEIFYLNKMRREQLGIPGWTRNNVPIFIWDYKSGERASQQSQEQLLEIQRNLPPPSPYVSEEIDAKRNLAISRTVHWQYIFNKNNASVGIISIFI